MTEGHGAQHGYAVIFYVSTEIKRERGTNATHNNTTTTPPQNSFLMRERERVNYAYGERKRGRGLPPTNGRGGGGVWLTLTSFVPSLPPANERTYWQFPPPVSNFSDKRPSFLFSFLLLMVIHSTCRFSQDFEKEEEPVALRQTRAKMSRATCDRRGKGNMNSPQRNNSRLPHL